MQIAVHTNENTKDIAEIKSQMATKEDLKKVMDNFIDPDTYKHFPLMNGDKIEADVAYTKIYKSAKINQLEETLSNSRDFQEVYSSNDKMLRASFTPKKWDVIITNGTSSVGIPEL